MAIQGPFTMFNLAKEKILLGGGTPINWALDTFNAVLTTNAQALSPTFSGGSGAARYTDLTAELPTANGYTSGGLALGSVTLGESAGIVTWDCANLTWTLSGGGITFKYLAIYDASLSTKDLVCYCDFDTSGGSLTELAGPFQVTVNGLMTLQ